MIAEIILSVTFATTYGQSTFTIPMETVQACKIAQLTIQREAHQHYLSSTVYCINTKTGEVQ